MNYSFKFKRTFFFLLVLIQVQVFPSCHFRSGDELIKFDRCEFYYENPKNSKYYGLLFLPGDKFFLKQYTSSGSDKLFYAILPLAERSNLNSFVKRTDSLSADSLEDFNTDQEWLTLYKLYKSYPTEEHTLYVHSLAPPKAIVQFVDWINNIKNSSRFILIDTSIHFKYDKIIHQDMSKNVR